MNRGNVKRIKWDVKGKKSEKKGMRWEKKRREEYRNNTKMSCLTGTLEFKISPEMRRNYLADLLNMPQELRNEIKRLDIINLWKMDSNGCNGMIQLLNTNLHEDLLIQLLNVLYEKHRNVFEFLLSQISNEKNTFLICCIEKQKYNIAKRILQLSRTMIYHANAYGKNILLMALSQKNVDMASFILEIGFDDLSLIDMDGNSALMYACMYDMEDMANKLMDCGIAKCFPEYANKHKFTALYHSMMNKMENVALRLIRSGHANVGYVGFQNATMLSVACMNKLENVVHEMLDYHKDSIQLELPDEHGQTAFMNCICFLNEDLSLKFLDTGRTAEHHINTIDETTLMMACSKGMEKLSLRLVRSGNVMIEKYENKEKCTALSIAIDNNLFEVAHEILLTGKSNSDNIDTFDETAFILACQKKCMGIVLYMLDHFIGIPTYVNKHNESGLYYCAINQWKELTERLIFMTSFDSQNLHDKKILDICKKNHDDDLVEIILEKMTDTEFLHRENEMIERLHVEKIQNELLLEEAQEKEKKLLKKQKEMEKKLKKTSPSNSPKHLSINTTETVLAPVVVKNPPPIVKATPAPVVVKATPPIVKATPAPVVVKSPPPIVKATPAPVVVKSPPPKVEATPAPVVVKSPPTKVEAVHETVREKKVDVSPKPSKKVSWQKNACETENVWKRNQKVESKFFDSPQVKEPIFVETLKEEILWIVGVPVPIPKEEPFMFAFHESNLPEHEYDELVARKVLGYIDIY